MASTRRLAPKRSCGELLPPSFGLLLQNDAEFGNVLHGAMRDLLAAGHDCVVLVNGDSPTLPPAFWRGTRRCGGPVTAWCSGRQVTAVII